MSIIAPSRNLADTFEAWSRTTTWAVLAAACSVLAALDRTVPEIGIGQAYVPLIVLVGWRLGACEAYAVALVAACLNIFPHHADEAGVATVVAAGRDVLRLGTLAFIAWAVGALRHAYDRERTAARCDALTGVPNRAAFEEYARAMLTNRPPSRPVTVLALTDIDDFKAINDTGGHGAGDEVLRAFASIASASLGPRERIGRLGGDEFLLLLEAETPEAGRARIETVHRRLTVGLGSSASPVTVSIGALVLPPLPHPEWMSAMRRADRIMYAVKASGKNGLRIETADTI